MNIDYDEDDNSLWFKVNSTINYIITIRKEEKDAVIKYDTN